MVAAAATLLLGGRLVHQEAKHGFLAPLFLFLVPFLCSTLRPLPSSRPGVGGVIPFAVSTEQLSGTALLLRFFRLFAFDSRSDYDSAMLFLFRRLSGLGGTKRCEGPRLKYCATLVIDDDESEFDLSTSFVESVVSRAGAMSSALARRD